MSKRKQDSKRIAEENHALASRLFLQKSELSKKVMDHDYKEYKRLRKHLQRVKPGQNFVSFSPRPKTQQDSRYPTLRSKLQSSQGRARVGTSQDLKAAETSPENMPQ
jgi:hypothetical protein